MIGRELPCHNHSISRTQLASLAGVLLLLVGCGAQEPETLSPPPLLSRSPAASRELAVPPRAAPVGVRNVPENPAAAPGDDWEHLFTPYDPVGDVQLVAFQRTDPVVDPLDAPKSSAAEELGAKSTASEDTSTSEDAIQEEGGAPDEKTTAAEGTGQAHRAARDPQKFEPLNYPHWPNPELMFYVTGRQHGYIEPCGCTGLENAKGGLSRRHTLLKDVRNRFGTVTALDVGNQVRRFGRQAELKFQATVDSLEIMKYQGIGFGPDDLKLSSGDLISAVLGAEPENSPFVCANVNLLGFTPTHRVVQVGKRRVGITAVMGAEHTAKLNSDDVEVRAPAEGLGKALTALEKEKCDLVVLLAHASLDETRELVRRFPKVQIVITAGGAGEPTMEPERIPGCFAYIIQVGTKGMYAGVVGIFMDPKQPVRYERVPLDARFEDSREMMDRFIAYQNDLKEHGFLQLGVRPVPHPFDPERTYVGHKVCADCHEHAFSIFTKTPHAHATQSLITPPNQRGEITRIYDPECVSCHVTGWDAQGYVPYVGGYWDVEKSAHLYANGCENCHGPGSRHVALESGDLEVPDKEYDERVAAYRKEMKLTLDEAKTTKCLQCHDLDNSPAFQEPGAFEKFWEQIKHYEADK